MVPPAQIQVDADVSAKPPPSYGNLLREAVDAVATARRRGVGPFDDPQQAADAVVDFERYLAISGRHLSLLLSPATTSRTPISRGHHALARRLAALQMDRKGGNAWTIAGDGLGLAHDVLATHVGPRGLLRTDESAVLAQPDVQVAAAARVIDLIVEPLGLSRDLLAAARLAQPRTDAPLTRGMSAHLRQATTALRRVADATPRLVIPTSGELDLLDRLTPTVSKVGSSSRAAHLSSRLSALRVLRQLSYRQAQGLEPANAHSLKELCVLGAATCRAAEALVPLPQTPLGRVRHAAALDQLRHAADLWDELSSNLYPRVQSLTRAPAIYHDAIQIVTHDARHHEAATSAVLAALPRLARQAAATVMALHNHGDLVSRERAPGQLNPRWQPLDAATNRQLSDAFAAAGQATRVAVDAVRREMSRRMDPARPTPHPTTLRQRHGLEVTR